jgi:competence protein CoiA
VLKTSRLGTRFFAHLALGGCASGDETPEHLHLKSLAIAAARAHGWTADAEVAGMTPGGEPWRADLLATRGRHRVAIEVQWSPQDDTVTRFRQARYADSGVRGLWLFRRPGFLADADVPALRVTGSLSRGLAILGLPAADALDAVFDRRLRFGIPAEAIATATVEGGVAHCWGPECGAFARVIAGVDLAAGESSCRLPVTALGKTPTLLAAVAAALPVDPLRGPLRVRRDGRMATGCFACGRPLIPSSARAGRFSAARLLLTVSPRLAAEIAAQPGYTPAWGFAAVAPRAASA